MQPRLAIVVFLAASNAHAQPVPPAGSADADRPAPPQPPPAPPEPTSDLTSPAVPPSPAIAPSPPASPPPIVTVGALPSAETPAAKDEPVVKISGAAGKGLTVKIGDTFSTNLRTRFQPRWQLHAAPPVMGDRTFDQIVNLVTARIWLSGTAIDPRLTYMLQLALGARDYRDGAISPIFDAFIDYKAHRELSVKVGQYFVPFDRLRTVREFALQLAERPRPIVELTLDRDVGVTLYSDNAFLGEKSPIAWRVSAFGGGGTNLTTPREPGALLVARVELRPLGEIDDDSEGDLKRRDKPGLALGAGVATNRNTNRQRSTTGPTFTGGTTDYLHLAIDAMFKLKGFAAQAEYLKKTASRETILSAADPAVLERARSGSGFVLQASYIFATPFEIVGRFARLYAPGGTDPRWITEVRNLGQEVATGVNYYLNGHQFKFQTTWIVRSTRDADFDATDHLVVGQLDATF